MTFFFGGDERLLTRSKHGQSIVGRGVRENK
jgi:hypothetical protein